MKRKLTFIIFCLILLILGPLLSNQPYWMHVVIICIYSSILAMSWLLILKIGHLSLAHAAFMGVGGIASALLVMEAGISFWLALPLSGLITAIIALILGFPLLRVKGIYFLIITFAFNELFVIMIRNWKFLGGYVGLIDVPKPNAIGAIDFSSKVHYYYLILFLAAVTVIILYRIYTSRIGRIFTSIGEDEDLARSIGIDVIKYKLIAFSIGCFFAGITGSFLVHYLNFAGAELFTTWQSLYIQIYAIVGGMGSVIGGPIVGAFSLILLTEFLDIPIKAQSLVYAAILILIIFFLRGGLISLPQRILAWRLRLLRIVERNIKHDTA